MFTLALVRLPPTATKESQYLNAKGALTYTDIAGDTVLYGNLLFFSSRRRHTICSRDWSSGVCSSDLRSAGRRKLRGALVAEVGRGQPAVLRDLPRLRAGRAICVARRSGPGQAPPLRHPRAAAPQPLDRKSVV